MGLEPDLVGIVTGVEPCPRIASGPGNVVLTTVDHDNQDVVELALESDAGERETLRPTGLHAMYSADRQAWVSAKNLTFGETVAGLHGPVRITSTTPLPGRHRVYNFTIENEHVYYVSKLAALGHNSSYGARNAQKGTKFPRGIDALEGNRLADSIRGSLNIEGRHIGLAEVAIEGSSPRRLVAVSGQASPVGTVPARSQPMFTTRPSGAMTREFDSDVKILEEAAQGLSPKSRGTIALFTEKPNCASCQGVIRQFREKFPRVDLILTNGGR